MSLKVNQNIAFRGNETVQPQQNKAVTNPANNSNTTPNSDKEKSNAMKYAIGATALAAVITLGILGRKGKLGKGIQKFLGGIETKAPETKAPEPKAPKTLARLKGEHYTGKLNIKLKDDNVLTLEYKDGLIQTAKKIDDEGYTVSSKSYKYDNDRHLIQILDKRDNVILKKRSIGNITRIDTKNGFCILENNTLKYRKVYDGNTYAYDKNGKIVGTIEKYKTGEQRGVGYYMYVTPDGTLFVYEEPNPHEFHKVLKSYDIRDKKTGHYQLEKEQFLNNDGSWSEPDYYYTHAWHGKRYSLSFGIDGKFIKEKDDDMPSEEAEKILTDISKRIKDAHKKALKIIYDVEENTALFYPKK